MHAVSMFSSSWDYIVILSAALDDDAKYDGSAIATSAIASGASQEHTVVAMSRPRGVLVVAEMPSITYARSRGVLHPLKRASAHH